MDAVEPTHSVFAQMHVAGDGSGWHVQTASPDGISAPNDEDDHHDGGQLHDFQGFIAGLGDTFDVLPPKIGGNEHRETGGGVIDGKEPAGMRVLQQLVGYPGKVLSRGHTADWPGEDVVEHQRGDRELGQGAAQRFLHHAVDAAAHEHAAAFHVDRADGIAEQHDREDEPRGGLADEVL